MIHIDEDYVSKIKQVLGENNGRLFLVDSAKCVSLRIVNDMLGAGDIRANSVLAIAADADIAADISRALSGKGRNFKTVAQRSDIDEILDSLGVDGESVARGSSYGNITASDRLKELYPHLIVTSDVLHSMLYSGDNVPFLFSDMLAECCYELVLIDDIFKLIPIISGKDPVDVDTTRYDRINFMSEAYYVDIAHSYNRLKKIVSGAAFSIVMSAYIAIDNAAGMYAVLDMLHDDYSFMASKLRAVEHFGGNYQDAIATTRVSIDTLANEPEVANYCYRNIMSTNQSRSNSDLDMSAYIRENFAHWSDEEIFLKVMDAYYHMANILDDPYAIFAIPENVYEIFWQILFCEEMKEEFEGVLNTAKVGEMDNENIEALYSTFLRHGVYRTTDIEGRCSAVFVHNDDSAFEYYVACKRGDVSFSGNEKGGIDFDNEICNFACEEDISYSAFNGSGSVYNKCLAAARILEERSAALIVAEKSKWDDIKKYLAQAPGQMEFSCGRQALSDKTGESTIILAEVNDVMATAACPDVNCAIVFDYIANPMKLKTLLHKLVSFGDAQAYVLLDDATMDGHLGAYSMDDIKGKTCAPFCVNNCMINGKEVDIDAIADRLGKLYKFMNCCTDGLFDAGMEAANFVDEYESALRDYTGTQGNDNPERDFGFISQVNGAVAKIFRNSISVGAMGESVISNEIELSENGAGSYGEKQYTDECERVILYNVCPRMLYRLCDVTKNNCNGCEHYGKDRVNNFDDLRIALKDFNLGSKDAVNRIRDEEKQASNDSDVLIASTNYRREQFGKDIITLVNDNGDYIYDSISFGLETDKPTYTDYSDVDRLRRYVVVVLATTLDRYYDAVMGILGSAMEQAVEDYNKFISAEVISASKN